jgi:hypothetical protein
MMKSEIKLMMKLINNETIISKLLIELINNEKKPV